MPFWSPDSRRIGVLTNDEKLKTIALDGSGAIPVCSAPRLPGGAGVPAWSTKGFILFQSPSGHLLKVPEKGGDPVPATQLGKGHVGHRSPSFLPDGEHFLFFASGVGIGELRVGSLSTTESRRSARLPQPLCMRPGIFFSWTAASWLSASTPNPSGGLANRFR